MTNVPDATVAAIAKIMLEMEPQPTHAPGLTGSTMAQDAMTMTIASPPVMSTLAKQSPDDEQTGYTEEELRITKKFVELIGDVERARELVDKVADCEDCLDIIDDQDTEEDIIGQISDTMPSSPDLPTGIMGSLYNSNPNTNPY